MSKLPPGYIPLTVHSLGVSATYSENGSSNSSSRGRSGKSGRGKSKRGSGRKGGGNGRRSKSE